MSKGTSALCVKGFNGLSVPPGLGRVVKLSPVDFLLMNTENGLPPFTHSFIHTLIHSPKSTQRGLWRKQGRSQTFLNVGKLQQFLMHRMKPCPLTLGMSPTSLWAFVLISHHDPCLSALAPSVLRCLIQGAKLTKLQGLSTPSTLLSTLSTRSSATPQTLFLWTSLQGTLSQCLQQCQRRASSSLI